MKYYISRSPEETIRLGIAIGRAAPDGAVVAFTGDLGAGKTCLSKGIAAGLGIEEEITSPTFGIVSEYQGRLKLYHVDAYRLGGMQDFIDIGGKEMLGEKGSLCLVEWSERIPEIVDADAAVIDIHVTGDGARRFSLSGDWLEEIVQ